jgi:hypothetical protein
MRRAKKVGKISLIIIIIVALAGTMWLVNPWKVQPVDVADLLSDPQNGESSIEATKTNTMATPIPDMEGVVENSKLMLAMNKKTSEVAVVDKSSGKIWYSNPQDRLTDPKATPFEKDVLSSLFSLTFQDTEGTDKTWYSYPDSAKKNQFTTENIPHGVRITYTLGDVSLGILALPKFISKERMDFFQAKMAEADGKYVLRRYILNSETNVYTRFDESLGTPVSLNKVLKAFESAGYDEQELATDNAQFNTEDSANNNKPNFVVAVEFTLENEYFVVRVPHNLIQEPKKKPIIDIHLLRYMGATTTTDQGYMVVPDGSGSLIYLNNGKVTSDKYVQPIYGLDEAINLRTKMQVSETIRLPIFGMKLEGSAMLGIVENGVTNASVNADISGKVNSYNHVYASFLLRRNDTLVLAGGSSKSIIPTMQEEPNTSDLAVKYRFLSGDQASYTGIAKAYQQYLLQADQLTKMEKANQLPFYLDLLGTVPIRKTFLGVPYEDYESLTTFAQAQKITDKLTDANVANIKLRYVGWFNGGIYHDPATHIDVDSELGGKSALQELQKVLQDQQIELFPDVSFTHIYHDTLGYSSVKESSRLITRRVATKFPYLASTGMKDTYFDPYFLLSPRHISHYIENFMADYNQLAMNQLSVRDIGNELYSDYRVGNMIERETSMKIVQKQLANLAEQSSSLMIQGGNAYTFPYVKHIIDFPLKDSGFTLTDEAIPLYPLVVHGYLSYAGTPINLQDNQDSQIHLLKALEYGANLRFEWFYANPAVLKDTQLDEKYANYYADTLPVATAMYEKLNGVLQDVQHLQIIDHTRLQDQVYMTTYAGGKQVIVNYNNRGIWIGEQLIRAKNYVVLEGQT